MKEILLVVLCDVCVLDRRHIVDGELSQFEENNRFYNVRDRFLQLDKRVLIALKASLLYERRQKVVPIDSMLKMNSYLKEYIVKWILYMS